MEKTDPELSDSYFSSRPRGSQFGALVSEQSSIVASRQFLEQRLAELENKYADGPVPRPEHWGGYRLHPTRYEFWQGRDNRLHDRIVYSRNTTMTWTCGRLP